MGDGSQQRSRGWAVYRAASLAITTCVREGKGGGARKVRVPVQKCMSHSDDPPPDDDEVGCAGRWSAPKRGCEARRAHGPQDVDRTRRPMTIIITYMSYYNKRV